MGKRPITRAFGLACDFYRARVQILQEAVPPKFDWREDILYRSPKPYPDKVATQYSLEILTLDKSTVYKLKTYKRLGNAERRLAQLKLDLGELTKLQFERKYLVSKLGG